MKHVHIGCGQTPTPGWLNYENSISVRLAKHQIATFILAKLGLLNEEQKQFISTARKSNIKWADATKRIPLPDHSVQVLYTSHMVEHLDRVEIKHFLKEARRVLSFNGIIRIVVPDLRKLVDLYIANGNADAFIEKTRLTHQSPRRLTSKLKYLITGERHHKWMYDSSSMVNLLSSMGFKDPRILPAGKTIILDPGELDLYEREDGSIYIEAFNA